jgi:hypothetical protein
MNPKAFIGILRVFSIFVLSEHEKKVKLGFRREQSSYFFIFKGSYLECSDTLYFYNFVGNQDLKFLFENLYLVFKFKTIRLSTLNSVLNSLQLPTTKGPF